MINRCVRCMNDFEANYRGNVCDGCSTIEPGFPLHWKPGIADSIILMKGTQWESKMSKAEEREISSGVSVPMGNGKFALGRREYGRIVEKPPRGYKGS